MDGAIGYAGQGSLQGGLGFHDTVLDGARFAARALRAGAHHL